MCNNLKSLDIRQNKIKKEDAPVMIIEFPLPKSGNQYLDITMIFFNPCGHSFIVKNKKLIPFSKEHINNFENNLKSTGFNISDSDVINILLSICTAQGKLNGIKFHKSYYQITLKESKDAVEKILSDFGIKTKEGCFIATACYGDYDAEEVIILRMYRDNVLMKSRIGRLFVNFYYSFSPFLAKAIGKSEKIKYIIRKFILNRLANLIKSSGL
jgi:hypothetical protein